ncbi:MAG: FecR domain-containing protein [Archangium sp.]|nr:FecR domain-containing protein [Archangium sp.]
MALFGERDLVVAGASSLVAAAALSAALFWGSTSDARTTPLVAAVAQSSGEVKLRPAQTLGWTGANRGADVFDGDAIFIPPGAEATIRFLDGTELSLDERSLVVIEKPRSGVRSVTLRQGSFSGRAGSEGLTLTTPNGSATLEAQTEARVELTGKELEVSVKKGTAQVKGSSGSARSVTGGQRVSAAQNGTNELAAWTVELTAPEAQARFAYRSEPAPVTLSWQGDVPKGARVQIARDRLFAFLTKEIPALNGTATVKEPARGVTWWRVVDVDGNPLSEARRFTCSEDVAPVLMFPRNGDVLLVPPGSEIAFSWTPLAGQSRYRLEISPSQGFEPVTATEEVQGSSVRLKVSLNEATWYWRVRTSDESGAGAPSSPMRFRVIHKGIPEAPELLNPEIEVTP